MSTPQADPVVDGGAAAGGGAGEGADLVANLLVTVNNVIGDPVFVHGVLMAASWAFLVPLALSAGRFKKVFGSGDGGKLFGMDRWFQIHRGANLLGVLFTLVAWLVMLPSPRFDGSASRVHTTFGLVVVILLLLQPLYASLRPGKGNTPAHLWPTPERKQWNALHFWSGRAMAIGAVYACYTGLELSGETFDDTFRQALWGSLTVMFAVGAALQVDQWRRAALESKPKKEK